MAIHLDMPGNLLDTRAASQAFMAARSAEAAQPALDACTAAEVPILKLLDAPCGPGLVGFGCEERWDMHEHYLPRPRRWQRQYNASAKATVDCQRGFFDAFSERLTREHWEQEWDAQPFRIAATPPRTMGKMLHQLVTANYFHLTLGPGRRPPLRSMPAPGHHFKPLPQPGFRWNVLDYGGGGREEIDYERLTTMAGNIFSRPLSAGRRCGGVRAAWHCLWQRFPGQRLRAAPAPGSAVGQAAHALYNLSLAGRQPGGMLQYLIAAGVVDVLTQVTPQVRSFLSEHLRALCHSLSQRPSSGCHRGGPYCGGTAEEQRTPVAAVHVRHGDSCDQRAQQPGPRSRLSRRRSSRWHRSTPPSSRGGTLELRAALHTPDKPPSHGACSERLWWNAMWRLDAKTGRLTRDGVGRRCYAWSVYREALRELQGKYGARTVLLSTDDHTGGVLRGLADERAFNWLYLDYPRGQFRKRAWMEFRSDLDEPAGMNAPFSLAAELELLSGARPGGKSGPAPRIAAATRRQSGAHLFVGNMGSHTSRMYYMKMVGATRTAVLPPFLSVDGYGMCCGFTDECAKAQVKARRRKIRECIYSYGLATGGEQYFRHRG